MNSIVSLFPFLELHDLQSNWMLSLLLEPPFDKGVIWSTEWD